MNYTGYLELTAKKQKERTIISNTYHYGAFKIARPIYIDPAYPTIYLLHVGGGYVDGDEYETMITVEKDSHLSITTQSATKVYKTWNKPVIQRTKMHVKEGGVLEYLPDPLIMYEKAKFIQETNVFLHQGASFFMSDIITPGWANDGQFFKYDYIRSKIKIYLDNKLCVYDHLLMRPNQDIQGIMKMEGYTHFGSLIVISPGVNTALIDELYDWIRMDSNEWKIGISELPIAGCVFRILGTHTQTVEKVIQKAYTWLRHKLLQKEEILLRKY